MEPTQEETAHQPGKVQSLNPDFFVEISADLRLCLVLSVTQSHADFPGHHFLNV